MGKASIKRVMEMLDPDNCAKVYEIPNIMARESFRLQKETVSTFDELVAICSRYYIHHFRKVIVDNVTPPKEYVTGYVMEILESKFRGGKEGAFKAASKGYNGGLPAVLDAIRNYFLEDQEKRYFEYTVLECVDVMDWDDIEALMAQFLQKYGRASDGDNLPSAKHLAPRYREIIRAHAEHIKNIRTYFSR